MLPALEIVLEKHREACEALAEHLSHKSDSKGFELFDEVLEYEFISIRVLNDAWRAVKGKV